MTPRLHLITGTIDANALHGVALSRNGYRSTTRRSTTPYHEIFNWTVTPAIVMANPGDQTFDGRSSRQFADRRHSSFWPAGYIFGVIACR